MDHIIEKKKKTPKMIILTIVIIAVVGLLLFMIREASGKSGMRVDAERITIAEVRKDLFREFIPATGIVQPLTTIYLDLQEGGRIEERFVEDGAILTEGQPILRLENTDLKLNLLNQETSVYNMIMQMQIAQNSARQNTIQKQTQVVDMENLLKEAKRVYDLNTKLYDKKIIPMQDYLESRNYYEYTLEKNRLVKSILVQDSIASSQQIAQQ
ncbi:MAG: efflux RND transporter periplasmic adaptor subunit [Tannerella sp.]|jgi:HlyD family secretion protein|nr:efflux RND transporter periplasmic adaptor subunit [Tannerella sp.]